MLIGCLVARTDSGTVFWPDTLLCVLASCRTVARAAVPPCLLAAFATMPPGGLCCWPYRQTRWLGGFASSRLDVQGQGVLAAIAASGIAPPGRAEKLTRPPRGHWVPY